MARIKDLVVDYHHPASLARFWAAVLHGSAVAAYDEAELNVSDSWITSHCQRGQMYESSSVYRTQGRAQVASTSIRSQPP